MITVTLHDGDAVEVLALLNVERREPNGLTIETSMRFFRAAEALKCALLLCDCDKIGAEVEK
jgi:hypothetical protein